jgi:hypothetical protein
MGCNRHIHSVQKMQCHKLKIKYNIPGLHSLNKNETLNCVNHIVLQICDTIYNASSFYEMDMLPENMQ